MYETIFCTLQFSSSCSLLSFFSERISHKWIKTWNEKAKKKNPKRFCLLETNSFVKYACNSIFILRCLKMCFQFLSFWYFFFIRYFLHLHSSNYRIRFHFHNKKSKLFHQILFRLLHFSFFTLAEHTLYTHNTQHTYIHLHWKQFSSCIPLFQVEISY